jgi:hypothetical protein
MGAQYSICIQKTSAFSEETEFGILGTGCLFRQVDNATHHNFNDRDGESSLRGASLRNPGHRLPGLRRQSRRQTEVTLMWWKPVKTTLEVK